jgi:hypothetical protein
MKTETITMIESATIAMRAVTSERRLNATQKQGTANANATAPELSQMPNENSGNPKAWWKIIGAVTTSAMLAPTASRRLRSLGKRDGVRSSVAMCNTPNEKKMSDGHRERVWAAVKTSKPLEMEARGGWPFAPSPG